MNGDLLKQQIECIIYKAVKGKQTFNRRQERSLKEIKKPNLVSRKSNISG